MMKNSMSCILVHKANIIKMKFIFQKNLIFEHKYIILHCINPKIRTFQLQ